MLLFMLFPTEARQVVENLLIFRFLSGVVDPFLSGMQRMHLKIGVKSHDVGGRGVGDAVFRSQFVFAFVILIVQMGAELFDAQDREAQIPAQKLHFMGKPTMLIGIAGGGEFAESRAGAGGKCPGAE